MRDGISAWTRRATVMQPVGCQSTVTSGTDYPYGAAITELVRVLAVSTPVGEHTRIGLGVHGTPCACEPPTRYGLEDPCTW